ncbi:MAG: hypothetical protein WC554_09395 [Clostridia bacterium]
MNKFERGLDPKEAMNIGIFSRKNFQTHKEASEWVTNHLTSILKTKNIPKDILNDTTHEGESRQYIHPKYFDEISMYFNKYITIGGVMASLYPEELHRFLKEKYPNLKSWLIEE